MKEEKWKMENYSSFSKNNWSDKDFKSILCQEKVNLRNKMEQCCQKINQVKNLGNNLEKMY